MTRVYRAQSEKHEYFIPTALRCHNFNWLQNNIDVTEWVDLNVVPKDKSNFPKPESHPDKQSIKAYYLSVKHILKKIEENPIFKNFMGVEGNIMCNIYNNSEQDIDSFKIDYSELGKCFIDIKSSLTALEQNNGTQLLQFLKLSHHFQHFNINFDELPFVEMNLNSDKRIDSFPTMCLDFSDDPCRMKAFDFIKDGSALYSIDIEKVPKHLYDSYKREYDWMLNGVTIGKNTNKLMKIQKGYCIYWPWKYSIKELTDNKMFGFRRERIPCHALSACLRAVRGWKTGD
jgi:hypothetical protein